MGVSRRVARAVAIAVLGLAGIAPGGFAPTAVFLHP